MSRNRATCDLQAIREVTVRGGLDRRQRIVIGVLLSAILCGLIVMPMTTMAWTVQLLIFGFTVIVAYKVYLYLRGGQGRAVLGALPTDEECPSYTALVPCYKEAKVLRQLVERLQTLDYPHHRLQILLLMEADDTETIAAAAQLDLPPFIQPLVVPVEWMQDLRGKPRALMYAVACGFVEGEYCVIWDAEDMVERDQLRKAVGAFRAYPKVACFQAELRWWNAEQNWLTRMMGAAYAHHFSMVLPGLCATNSVVPLGGTSNHIRVAALDEVGWWDPYNVTEDLDLGVKLRRAGYRVMILPSITWEEATGTFRQQMNQMSRWTKGYSATSIAHLRHPVRLARDLGIKGTVSFFAVVFAAHPASLAAPIFWLMTLTYIATGAGIIQQITPFAAFYLGLVCMIANFFFVVAAMLAVIRTEQYRLWPWLFLLPIHWATIGCAAALKAMKEVLVGKLYYWDKTPRTHLYEERAEIAAGASTPS